MRPKSASNDGLKLDFCLDRILTNLCRLCKNRVDNIDTYTGICVALL